MSRDQWSVKDKLRFEFCSRMPMAAITYIIIGSIFFLSDLAHDPVLKSYLSLFSLGLIAVSIPRVFISYKVIKNPMGQIQFSRYYKAIFALSFLTFIIVDLILVTILLDPQIDDASVLTCVIISTAITGAAIFSISLEPVLFATVIICAFLIPAGVVTFYGRPIDTLLRVVGAMQSIYLIYVVTTARQFRKNSASRYETENKLNLEKVNLKLALDEIQKAQAEIILQKAKAEHSARMAALGQMAGGVAHEINSPLAIISLSMEIIKLHFEKNHVVDEDMQKHMSRIQTTVDRISKIIRNLLFFSRDGGQEPFQKFCMNSLIQRTLTMCQEKILSSGIELIYNSDLQLWVNGREVQFSQVLLNLLNNAFDACVHGEKPWIRIELKDLENWIEVAVSNSGPLIQEEIRNKLFEPFFTTKDIGQGTGLGLSLSRGIVEEHGGQLQLDVQSAETRFYFQLPKATE